MVYNDNIMVIIKQSYIIYKWDLKIYRIII